MEKKMEKSITIRLGTEEMQMVEKIAEKMQKKEPFKKITTSDVIRKSIRQAYNRLYWK